MCIFRKDCLVETISDLVAENVACTCIHCMYMYITLEISNRIILN